MPYNLIRFVTNLDPPAYGKTLKIDPVALVIRNKFLKAYICCDSIVAAFINHRCEFVFLGDLPVTFALYRVMKFKERGDITYNALITECLADDFL